MIEEPMDESPSNKKISKSSFHSSRKIINQEVKTNSEDPKTPINYNIPPLSVEEEFIT